MTTPLRRLERKVVYGSLIFLGACAAFTAAPGIEATLAPVLADVYLVPPDATHPERLYERFPDRVCWRQHVHKVRTASAVWWSVAMILPNGDRVLSGPLDERTGQPFESNNGFAAGFDGAATWCSRIPLDISPGTPLRVESHVEYDTGHGLWLVPQETPTINVPGETRVGDGS